MKRFGKFTENKLEVGSSKLKRISEILRELEAEAEINRVPILRGSERDILLSAAEKAKPEKILEIGTAIGFSALLLAERFPGAEITTLEIAPVRHARAERAVRDAGCAGRIHCLLGDAAEILPTLSGHYDFLYLDGPKGQYLAHLKLAEPLLSPLAVIAADNVLFRGLVKSADPVPHRYRTLVMKLRAYLAYVEENYETEIFGEGDGMAISISN